MIIFFPGHILQMCSVKDNMQEALTAGTKIYAMDIDINDDRFIMEDLSYVKEHRRVHGPY